VTQFDVAAALRRHLPIPQTRDRRYKTKLTHYRGMRTPDGLIGERAMMWPIRVRSVVEFDRETKR
jgi:hypothetical protein